MINESSCNKCLFCENFSSDGSMWHTGKKEASGTTATKLVESNEEECWSDGAGFWLTYFGNGLKEVTRIFMMVSVVYKEEEKIEEE